MAGYRGTADQQRLQKRADDTLEWALTTPGAAVAGRNVGADDPERLGWDTVFDILEKDGLFTFRLMPVEAIPAAVARFAERGYRTDFWDVFTGGRESVLAGIRPILAAGLPDGLVFRGLSSDPEGADVAAYQDFLLANGMAPFSGSILVWPQGTALWISDGDEGSAPVATAYAYFPHNRHSPHHRTAWIGLIAVAESHRGLNLGSAITAKILERAILGLGATAAYGLVSETNIPSRRMLDRCGLRLDPSVRTGAAIPADRARFTR